MELITGDQRMRSAVSLAPAFLRCAAPIFYTIAAAHDLIQVIETRTGRRGRPPRKTWLFYMFFLAGERRILELGGKPRSGAGVSGSVPFPAGFDHRMTRRSDA